MNELINHLPLFLPLIMLQLGLAIFSLVHVLRHRKYKFGTCLMWSLVVCLIQFIGPLVYFVWGRGDEE